MLRTLLYRLQRLVGCCPHEPLGLYEIMGFWPRELSYYRLALTHSSVSGKDAEGFRLNNERLEFLGDSVLATAMSNHLYHEHPHWQEGELSKRRSALVKRKVNNAVAQQIGLHKLLRYDRQSKLGQDAYGDTLEAFIGAIFLDQGYDKAERFVLERVLPRFGELEDKLERQTTNYKSLLLEWTQQHHFEVEFRMLVEPKRMGAMFVCGVYVDERRISTGQGTTKKEAHQEAARVALEALRAADPRVAKQLSDLPG